MRHVFDGFKAFILRGNAIDLAVGVVVGAAFTAVVNAIVTGLIDPLVAAVFGKPDLTGVWNFTINNAHFSIGLILQALFSFLCVAIALYFVLILPMNALANRRSRSQEPEPEEVDEDVIVLREIRDLLAQRPDSHN